MQHTRLIMGMPITVAIDDAAATRQDLEDVFNYFVHVDTVFSTYKPHSEISRINAGLPKDKWSDEVKDVLFLCDQTHAQTNGYFNIRRGKTIDPSGLVKGWAINNAASMLRSRGFKYFYIDAGGDTQVSTRKAGGTPWRVGIRSPFVRNKIIKILDIAGKGVATSGTYVRGQHIYNPHAPGALTEVASLTVVGPTIYDADRYATAAFAMGKAGISFIESLPGHEAYMVEPSGVATATSGFGAYEVAA